MGTDPKSSAADASLTEAVCGSSQKYEKVIFVFGSNLAGRHGAGAALHARKHWGAVYGLGTGMQGRSYAIPTKDVELKPLALECIQEYVREFCKFAASLPTYKFEVSRVGCGLAGYVDAQIAPMFASAPPNCVLPVEWRRILYDTQP